MLRSTSAGADSEYLKKIYQAFCVLMIFVILGQRFLIPRDNYPDEEVPVDLDTKTVLLASVPKKYIFKIKKRLNRKHKNTI